MILLQCPPAASPLPPVVGTGGYTLVEPWDYGISQVGRGARGSPNPNTGSSRNHASAQSDDQTLPELQQLWGCARCLGGVGGLFCAHRPPVTNRSFGRTFWRGSPLCRAPGTMLRCWPGAGGGGELEGRRCEPLVPRPINTVLRSVPCPRAPRGGAGWSGAERSGAGGAERERTGSDGGAEVGPGAAGVRGRERAASGGGAAPNLPPPARSPVMGPRALGLPVPRTPTAGPCAPPRSSCPPPPKAAAFPSFLRPASAPCARTPRRPPAAPAAPRGPPTPASAPFLPKGRTLPRPASEGRGAEGGGGS